VIAHLPWRLRSALLETICEERDPFTVMSALAQKCGVIRFVAQGDYGLIQSSSRDQTILRSYALEGTFAKSTNERLSWFFATRGGGGTYIDVGANIGLTTIAVAKNPLVHCIAIEPDPENFANLVANISANCPHGNVDMRQAAISDATGHLTLALSPDNLGDHRVRKESQANDPDGVGRRRISVEAVRLDSFAADIKVPLAVKIDTQGAEPFVIAGGSDVLSRADLLTIEFDPRLMRMAGGDPRMVVNFLTRHFSVGRMAFRDQEAQSEPAATSQIAEELLKAVEVGSDRPFYWFDITVAKRLDDLTPPLRNSTRASP
jgi:FkbM family methyltransferase